MKEKVLNLGCGKKPIKGAVNLDVSKHHDYVDVVHNLNQLPWPFNDGEFDKIAALAVLEHLDIDLLTSINECWRILKPGGILVIKLPHVKGYNAWDDVTHRWFVTIRSLDQFCPNTQRGRDYDFYTPFKWKYIKGPRLNKAKTSVWATMEKLPCQQSG